MQDMVEGLTHWGRMTHICANKLNIMVSDNGLSPSRRQVFIWTNAGIMLTDPLATKLNEIFTEFHTFLFHKMHLKISSASRWPFFLGLYVSKTAVGGFVVTMHEGMWGQELPTRDCLSVRFARVRVTTKPDRPPVVTIIAWHVNFNHIPRDFYSESHKTQIMSLCLNQNYDIIIHWMEGCIHYYFIDESFIQVWW